MRPVELLVAVSVAPTVVAACAGSVTAQAPVASATACHEPTPESATETRSPGSVALAAPKTTACFGARCSTMWLEKT